MGHATRFKETERRPDTWNGAAGNRPGEFSNGDESGSGDSVAAKEESEALRRNISWGSSSSARRRHAAAVR